MALNISDAVQHQATAIRAPQGDVHALQADLRRYVTGEVRFDEGSRALYAAGSFGLESEHYDISMQIGERHLLPTVRQAPSDTLIVADGFSCRTQIREATDRRPLHLAELLRMAFDAETQGVDRYHPERYYADANPPILKTSIVALVGAALIGGLITARALTRR